MKTDYRYLSEKEMMDSGILNDEDCTAKLKDLKERISSGELKLGKLLDCRNGEEEAGSEGVLMIPAGIMAALAAPRLVKNEPKVLSLVGIGGNGKCALFCFLKLFASIETVKLMGTSMASKETDDLKTLLELKYPSLRRVIICETLEEACRGADVLLEAQTRDTIWENTFGIDWLKRGASVFSMGHFVVEDRQGFSGMKKVADQYALYDRYMDDFTAKGPMDDEGRKREWGVMGMHFVHLVKCHGMSRSEIADLAGVVNGTVQGRAQEDEIIVCGIGINLED